MAVARGNLLKMLIVVAVLGLLCWPYASSWVICCSFLGLLMLLLARSTLLRHDRPGSDDRGGIDGAVYGLDHGKLNITLPPPTMWMNMGYWKETSDFATACCALLDEVLKTAKLMLPAEDRPLNSLDAPNRNPITVIDLGFGCGDQTVYLMQAMFKDMPAVSSSDDKHLLHPIDRYVGVTLNRRQFLFAQSRLTALKMLSTRDRDIPYLQIFCEDAARPGSWSSGLDRATQAGRASPFQDRSNAPKTEALRNCNADCSERWVLALDTLFHFSPSRQPILDHAYRELQASVMAYDLMLADHVSMFDRALLFVASFFTGTPFSNFLTESQYRRMLVLAGYAEEDIEVRDVSEYVFTPLARFLDQRDKELKSIGLGIGAFRAARWLFRWWGKAGVVRGMIVVARR